MVHLKPHYHRQQLKQHHFLIQKFLFDHLMLISHSQLLCTQTFEMGVLILAMDLDFPSKGSSFEALPLFHSNLPLALVLLAGCDQGSSIRTALCSGESYKWMRNLAVVWDQWLSSIGTLPVKS